MAAANCLNLPVPRGFNDSEMEAVRERLILPAVAGFAPDAIVLQCGADAVTEDPLSRLTLSNNGTLGGVARADGTGMPAPAGAGGGRRLQPLVGGAALDRGSGRLLNGQ